jgi:acyl-CoA thioester hydrolase
MATPTRDQFRNFIEMPVRWGDMDAVGHVNNTKVLVYAESGRIDYFNEVINFGGFDGVGPILGEITCRFIEQMKYPADLTIGTRAVSFGNKTMTLQTAVFVGESPHPAAVIHAVIVCFDYEAQKTVPVPESMIDKIMAFEILPPERT